MAEFTLKDWCDKEQTFDKETIYVRGTDGELIPFSLGTGGSADVRYVTFMSYDGLIEYGKKAVAVGDDCADPIARGVFDTPTRESDVYYNYTFYGWANEANGAAVSSILKAVTEDKTVYANFATSYVYYTVKFYDDDNVTLLETKKVTYGENASYTPEKSGYKFMGWSEDVTNVTADMTVYASWEIDDGYIHDSWETVVARAKEGTAAEYYRVGDKIALPLNYADGTSETIDLHLAAFNAGKMEDGSKCNIAFVCAHALKDLSAFCTTTITSSKAKIDVWSTNIDMQKHLDNDVFPALPSVLQENILTRYTRTLGSNYANLKLWNLNFADIYTNMDLSGTRINLVPIFPDDESKKMYQVGSGTPVEWWLNSGYYTNNRHYMQIIDANGFICGKAFTTVAECSSKYLDETPPSGLRGVVFGFCI